MKDQIKALESEVQEIANQHHDKVLSLLIDKIQARAIADATSALQRYVAMKLTLHRIKKKLNSYYRDGDEEKLIKDYNFYFEKMKEARREYYECK